MKTDSREELIRRIVDEEIPALNLARQITLRELVGRYGDPQSNKVFQLGDYKDFLLNRYLEEAGNKVKLD